MELFGTDAVDWAHGATKHMVGAVVLTSFFERHNVEWFFHYGYGGFVAVCVAVER